ncbi:MAG: hypothetical protein ACYC6W_12535 [Nitrosotalea sp.]
MAIHHHLSDLHASLLRIHSLCLIIYSSYSKHPWKYLHDISYKQKEAQEQCGYKPYRDNILSTPPLPPENIPTPKIHNHEG